MVFNNFLFWNLQNVVQVDQARIAEGVLDGALNVAANANFRGQAIPGHLPDIGLGINENCLFGPVIPAPVDHIHVEEPPVNAQAEVEAGQVNERVEADEADVAEVVEQVDEAGAGAGAAQHLEENEAEKSALEEVRELIHRHISFRFIQKLCSEDIYMFRFFSKRNAYHTLLYYFYFSLIYVSVWKNQQRDVK